MPTPEPPVAQGANGEGKPATQRKATCKIRNDGLDAGHVCNKSGCVTEKEGPVTREHVRKATSAEYMSQEQFDKLNKMLEPYRLQADAKQTEVRALCARNPAIRPYVCPHHWHFSFHIPKNDPMCREHRAEYLKKYSAKSAENEKTKTKQEDPKATSARPSQAVAGASSSSRHDPPRSGRSQSPPPENRGTTRSRTPMHRSGSSARESTHHGASPAPASQSAERGHQTRDPSKGAMPPSGPSDGDRRARDRTPVPPPGSSAGDPTHHEAQEVPKPPSPMTEAKRRKLKMRVVKNTEAVRAANHHRDPNEGNRPGHEPLEMPEVKKYIQSMNEEDDFERWVRARDEQGWVSKGPRG